MLSFPIYWGSQCVTLLLLLFRDYLLTNNRGDTENIVLKTRHKFLIFLSLIPIFLLLALRYEVGTDYNTYRNAYLAISGYSFFDVVPESYARWLGIGFVYFCKLIVLFAGDNFLWFYAVVALLSLLCLYMAIFKNSKLPLLSLFIFFAEGYYYQMFNQVRQFLAVMIVFISYGYILKKRLAPFFITVIIASLIHPSALIFLPAYYLQHIKFNSYIFFIIIISSVALVLCWPVVEYVVSYTRYAGYFNSAYNETGRFTTILWSAYRFGGLSFCLFYRKNLLKKYPEADVLYISATFALVLQIFSVQSYIFSRVVIYYYIGTLLLIPYIIKSIKKEERLVVLTGLLAVFSSAHVYYFFSKADELLAPYYKTFLGS